MTDYPKISIVTPSYNQGQFIEETILSVLNQNYPNLEYIIIDGGSIDNTVEIIKKYEEKITYWISEKDEGQSDAIIKGFEKCSGEWINWLNSDDLLLPNALFQLAIKINSLTERTKVIIFGTQTFLNTKNLDVFVPKKPKNLGSFFDKKDYPIIPQPSTFFKNGTIYPDKAYHYVMDWTLYISMYLRYGDCFETSPSVIAKFRLHDTSKTVLSQRLFGYEAIKFLQTNLGKFKPYLKKIKSHIEGIKLHILTEKIQSKTSKKQVAILLSFGKLYPSVWRDRFFWGAILKNLKH